MKRHGRRKPYTDAGVRRLPCIVKGCKNKAHACWQACADSGLFRPICLDHDIALNRMVLTWMGDPQADAKMAKYEGSRP